MNARFRAPLVGSVLFGVYALTCGHSVGWEDSAFFQLAHATLGVPHGPGFPLYVLVGRVWTLPFGLANAWGSNLLSAAAMAGAGALMLELMITLAGTGIRDRERQSPDPWAVAAGVGVVLGWGTLELIWRQAVRTEVYPLTLLLVLLVAQLALRADREWRADPARARRLALAAFWVWGLALAVHPLLALAAGAPWLVPLGLRWRRAPASLLCAVLTVALPLLLYLYPLLRGRCEGVWAWGAFTDLGAALDYYLRRSAWAVVSTADRSYLENLRGWAYAFHHLWPAAIWVPGLVALIWLRRAWGLWLSLAGTLALLLWAAPFAPDNLDLWGYFLPVAAGLTVAAGVLVLRLVVFLRAQMHGLSYRSRQALGFFTFSLLLGWPTVAVLSTGRTIAQAEGANEFLGVLAASLPPDAVVLAAEDNLLGPLEYAQRVEGLRPDLHVIAPGALRYPFYREQVRALLPAVPQATWAADRAWSMEEWRQAVRGWLSALPDGRPVYTPYAAIPGLPADRLCPAGLLYALLDSAAPPPGKPAVDFWLSAPRLVAHDPVGRDLFARWQFNFGSYAMARGEHRLAWAALSGAVATAPDNPELYYLLGKALVEVGEIDEASAMFAAAVELAPYRTRYRRASMQVMQLRAGQP